MILLLKNIFKSQYQFSLEMLFYFYLFIFKGSLKIGEQCCQQTY